MKFPDGWSESFCVKVFDMANTDAWNHGGYLGNFIQVNLMLLFF